MPSKIAAIIFIIYIGYLFYSDAQKKYKPSHALWLPTIWMFIAGSRYASSWLSLSSPLTTSGYQEGSPIDRMVFASLIAAGTYTLFKRRIPFKAIVSENKWVFFYFIYCAISILWSDYPFISFKRWIKEVGTIVMVLLVLTEKRPYVAFGTIFRRLAFVMIPMSVLFIKYFPDLGRAYHFGTIMYTGVAHQKNHLGQICMISGIYLVWNILYGQRSDDKPGKTEFIAYFILFAMGSWLLYIAHSATSISCLAVASGILIACKMQSLSSKPNRVFFMGVFVLLTFMFLEATINIRELILEALGRDASLTDRVPVWNLVLSYVRHPLIGEGYQSFWTGDRMVSIWDALGGARIVQAHNGYLETYLNLGVIGLSLLIMNMVVGTLKVKKQLQTDYPNAILRLCFIVIASLYNYTEASFYAIANIWLLLILALVDVPAKYTIDGKRLNP